LILVALFGVIKDIVNQSRYLGLGWHFSFQKPVEQYGVWFTKELLYRFECVLAQSSRPLSHIRQQQTVKLARSPARSPR
jgi:hypothetical protein